MGQHDRHHGEVLVTKIDLATSRAGVESTPARDHLRWDRPPAQISGKALRTPYPSLIHFVDEPSLIATAHCCVAAFADFGIGAGFHLR
jgi:hypothetical protein